MPGKKIRYFRLRLLHFEQLKLPQNHVPHTLLQFGTRRKGSDIVEQHNAMRMDMTIQNAVIVITQGQFRHGQFKVFPGKEIAAAYKIFSHSFNTEHRKPRTQ